MLFAWAAWFAVALMIQGGYIIRRGVIAPFFMTPRENSSLPVWKRVKAATIYLVSGTGLFAITMNEVIHRSGIRRGAIIPAALLSVAGVIFLTRPGIAVMWARSDHSSLSMSDPFLLTVSRVIGAVLLFFGLLFLTIG
jgi:hypothetical protein